MSEKKHIDQLFSEGLAGREVPYSEGAWAGADHLLTRHYRKLFWKKAALLAAPIAAASAALLWLLSPSDEAAITPVQEMPGSGNARQHASPASADAPATAIIWPQEISKTQTGKDAEPLNQANGMQSNTPDTQPEASSANAATSINKTRTGMATGRSKVPSSRTEPPDSEPETSGTGSGVRNPAGTTGKTEQLFASGKVTSPKTRQGLEKMPRFSIGQLGSPSADLLEREEKAHQPPVITRKWLVKLEAGSVVSTALRNTGGNGFRQSYGWHAGLQGRWYFQPTVALGLHATLHQRSGLHSRAEHEGKAFDQHSATYLDIAGTMHWNLYRRHTIGLGVAIAPLIDVRAENALEDAGKDKAGFAELDAAGLLFYEFRLTQRLDINAGLRFGAFDLTDNAFYGTGDVNDRNHQLRLGIGYRILQR